MDIQPPRRSVARLALFLASFAFAVLLGSSGEASRRGLWPIAALGFLASGWMIYLASLWLAGRTLRKSDPGNRGAATAENRADLFAEASLLLGSEEASRLMKTLSPEQMRLFLEKKKPAGVVDGRRG